MRKSYVFTVVAYVWIVAVGCATKSVFPITDRQEKDQVFQYCGGQEWGYLKKINKEDSSPYLAVYLESEISEKSDVIVFNFAVQAKESLDFSQPSEGLLIQIDGHEVYNKHGNFGIVRAEKSISDRYPHGYAYKKINNNENDWEVRKMKYNGLFGQLALEEPFIVKIAKHSFEEIKEPESKINYNNDMDAIYIIRKVVIPFGGGKAKTSEISVQVPAFGLNGVVVPKSKYTFHFDREQLIERSKGANRCASLEEIFRAGRNKDSWIWWMYPRISN